MAYVIPDGLAAMLRSEDVAWAKVWGPIKKAAKQGKAIEFAFNLTDFAFGPKSRTVVVGGLTVEDGEIRVQFDDFPSALGSFFRGGPK